MAEAAVAVGLGASVISFIGLTGQILQGCKVVCDCLDDIKEAPKEIRHILDQLKNFESEIRNLQYTLEKTRQSTDILHFEEHIKSSLELSESIINDLRDLVGRYKRDGKKDWWKDFKFTKKKNTFTKYINRLNEAKIIIINVKSSLTMDLILDTRRMMVTAPSVQPMPSVSTTITTQTHQVSSKQYTQSSTQTCRDVTHAVHDSLDARLDPFSSKIVKSSVDIALKDFILNHKSNTGTQISDSDLLGNGRPMPTTGDCNGGFFGGVSRLRVIGQTTTNRIINAWLATIVIRSTTTNLQEIFEENKTTAEEPLVTSRTIHRIDIHPSYFVRARYLVFMEQKRSGSIFACSDMRLKCYNKVPLDAPIVEACSKGDLSTVRRLFADGKASPHDIVISSEIPAPYTLVSIVWGGCYYIICGINRELPCHHCISRSLIYLNKLFRVLEYLVEQGIDPADCTPNHGTYPLSLFWRVVAVLFGCHPLVVPLLEQLIRLILKKSLNDPFGYIAHPVSRTWSGIQYSMVAQFIDCVQTQEIWPFTGIESMENELELPVQLLYYEGAFRIGEPPYALFSDPQGMYIRRVIRRFRLSDFCMESYCMQMLTASTRLNKEDDNVQLAVRSRIFQCLRAGMKLNHINRREHIIGGRTLYSLCKHMGKLNFLRSILHDTGYNDVEIDAMFEDSRYIMLEASLNSLRPSRIIEEGISRRNDDRSLEPQRLLASKMLMLDPEYQKFFPDEGKLDRNVETYFPREYDPEGEGWRKFKDELFNHYTITWRNEDDYILISLLPQETQTILRNDLGLSK